MPKIIYRSARLEDAAGISRLEKRVWGKNAATLGNIKSRLSAYAEGNIVGVKDGEIVGYVCGFVTTKEFLNKCETWYDYTDKGNIKGAVKVNGDVLFGVSLTVDKSVRNAGIGSSLLINIARLAVRNNLEYGVLGGRLPFYYKKKNLPVDKYIELQEGGKLYDPELRLYKRMGLEIIKVQPDYFKDPESLNYGVILKWTNPLFWLTKRIPFTAKPLSFLFKL